MRKTFLLMFFMVAALLPQSSWASDVTVDISLGTLTITSQKAGALATFSKTEEMKACTTIVLVGKFNGADMESIKQDYGFHPTTVDMSQAVFYTDTSSSKFYKIFSSEAEKSIYSGSLNNNDQCMVGALYKSTQIQNDQWVRITDETEINSISNYQNSGNWDESQLNTNPNYNAYNPGDYIKFSDYHYYRRSSYEWQEVTDATEISNIQNAQTPGWSEADLSNHEQEYNVGDHVKLGTEGNYKYFKKVLNKRWIPVSEAPNNFKIVTFAEADRDSHFDDAGVGDGEYIAFEIEKRVYKKVRTNTIEWVEQTHGEGDVKEIDYVFVSETEKNETAPSQADKYCVLLASSNSIYIYEDGDWITPQEEIDYSNAKFGYWKNYVENCICPSGIAIDQLSSQLLAECDNNKIKSVDFGNIILDFESNFINVSARNSVTLLESMDLHTYLQSNSNLDGMLNNKIVLYGDNINAVHFTNGGSDYTMYFSGTTVEIVNNKTDGSYAELADKHTKSTMNFQTIKFNGKFSNINNFSDAGSFVKEHTTIDFSEAEITGNGGYNLGQWKAKAIKYVFSDGEATIGETLGNNSVKITIKAADATKQGNIKSILTSNNWYPEAGTEGDQTGRYTYEITIPDVAVETTWTLPTLSVGTTDTNNIGTENVKDLCTIVTEKIVNANELTTITFADGSTYDKATGKLVTTSTNYVAIKMWIEACETLGLHVNTIELGKYVSIDYTNASYPEGITIINNTGTDAMEHLIGQSVSRNTNLTDAEKKAITDAVHLKMNGQFDNDDFLGLKNIKSGVGSVMPTTLDFSEAQLLSDQRMPSDWATSVTEIKLPGSFVDVTDNTKTTKEIPAGFCENFTHITSVNIPNTITSVGESAFRGCTQLNVVDWSTALVEIKEHAFERCGFGPTLIIPNSVKYIREDAFRNCYNVNYLYIQEGSMLEIVESGVFFNDESDMPGLKEVHVDCNHFIWCDIDAFDDTHTNGHTDVATAKCRLFYPAVGITDYDPEYPEKVSESENNSFQDFVGVFKSKLFNGRMKQSDLQTLKTVITQGAEINGEQYGPYPGHGWFMFTSTGITITPTTTWRTYSEAVNFTVPKDTLAEIYLVCGYESNGNASVTKLVKMNPGDPVPANTGVIIHYVCKEDFSTPGDETSLRDNIVMPLDYYDDSKLESPLKRYDAQYVEENAGADYTKGGKTYKNYLRKLNVEPVYIYNVEKVNGEPTYRNFFFNNADQMNALTSPEDQEKWWGKDWGTDCRNLKGWGFFRAKTGNYAVNNKAYLHLPATMALATAGASTTSEVSTNAPALGIVIINDDDTTTKIDNVVISQDNLKLVPDCYYTLSGQRVMTPVKGGIYIHNGKKVIVK